MGGRRPQAARRRRSRRVGDGAEDRRARDQPHLRERCLRARRDPRRRRPGRGRDRQPAHDLLDSAADARRRRAVAARGARRGLHAALRIQRAQRAARGGGEEDGAEPAQRGRRLAAAEGLLDHGAAAALALGLRDRRARGTRARLAVGDARVAPRARLPDEPVRRAARVGRRGRPRLRRVGDETGRARLRDRRDRDQGRLARPAAPPRRAARAAALGARLQVGAADRADAAEQDPHPRRSHGQPQPVGAARAGRGRRRHRLAGDAPQRGGHQPQGHPSGRRRDRAARGRRDPAGRRPGAAAPQGTRRFKMPTHCPLCGTEVVKPEGEAMHRCPNRRCPSRGSRR